MPSRYRWADLVVCRAGAISVAELALAGRAGAARPARARGRRRAVRERARARARAARRACSTRASSRTRRSRASCVALLEDPALLRAMGEPRRRARPARRRRGDRRRVPAARGGPRMSGRFRGIERIHFVGIGGIGMCGLAELLRAQGYHVTGSDLARRADRGAAPRARRRRRDRPRRAPRRRAPTSWWCRPRCAGATRSCVEAERRGVP